MVIFFIFLVFFQKPSTSSKEKKDSEQDLRNRYLERKRNEELEKIVDRHDKKKRSKSLLEIHQKELKRKVSSFITSRICLDLFLKYM